MSSAFPTEVTASGVAAPAPRRPARRPRALTTAQRRHARYVPLAFLGPVLLVQVTFLFLPLINTFVLSFTDAQTIGGGRFVGLDNFARLAADAQFWAAVGRSVLYVAVVVPTITALSLSLALLINTTIRGSAIVRGILFSPFVLPMAIVAMMFDWLLSSDGMINQLLEALHVVNEPVRFLSDPSLALFSIMAVTIWKSTALYTLILLAALRNVSQELDEAAELDGAGWLRRTWQVTLPQIRGTTILIAILAAVASIRAFTEPYVMTGGGPGRSTETLVLYLYRNGISPGTDAGYASAISLFLFFMVVLVSVARWLATRRHQESPS
ncbi:carbohydrate ABC transporter permease [Saccharomonospora azurea]|uniref:carbohydrate ABC transporter permease n=1 Tax=Saccharomonospora azurea TaxID=40988 RepID=UPI003D89C080